MVNDCFNLRIILAYKIAYPNNYTNFFLRGYT